MANPGDPAEVSQLARLLFDEAAQRWYLGIALEAVVGLVAIGVVVIGLSGDLAIATSAVLLIILGAGYAARLWAESANDIAETMRRQAAVSEGLGWPIERLQLAEWRRKAGKKLRFRLARRPRDSDFYSSTAAPGPRRMAEQTAESAFFTRHMQLWLRSWLVRGLLVLVTLLVLAMYMSLSRVVPDDVDAVVAQVVFLVVPLAVSLNAVGWVLHLSRTSSAIQDVEATLERLLRQEPIREDFVLRSLAEYDCQLAKSLPMHPAFFRWKHDELSELWDPPGASTVA